MKKIISLIALIIIPGSIFAETLKIGPFILKKIEKKEDTVKIENVIIKSIKDNTIYLEDGEIKVKNIEHVLLGNSKSLHEIVFPVIADIVAIKIMHPSEVPYGNIKEVLKIIIKSEGYQEFRRKF